MVDADRKSVVGQVAEHDDHVRAKPVRDDRDENRRGNEHRAGKGLAIRKSVARASGRLIGFADADNKVPIAEIEKLLPCFNQGYDIVIGSRGMLSSVAAEGRTTERSRHVPK